MIRPRRVLLLWVALALATSACGGGADAAGGFAPTGTTTIVIPGDRDHVLLDFDVHLAGGAAILELIGPTGAEYQIARLVGPRDVRSSTEATGASGPWSIRWTTTGANGTYRLSWSD